VKNRLFLMHVAVGLILLVPPVQTAAYAASPRGHGHRHGHALTEADSGKTIFVNFGQTVRVTLHGSVGNGWTAAVSSNESALETLASSADSAGNAAGRFKATAPGLADITATQDPSCRRATPPCEAPTRLFVVHVHVNGRR
jgi:hypothetical protein